MRTTRTSTLKRRTRGQGLVEFALVAPAFLLLVFGTIELGRLVWTNHEVANGTREAARWVMVRGQETGSCAGSGGAEAEAEARMAGVDAADFSLTVSYPDGDCEPGSRAQVSSTYSFDPIISWILGTGTITLQHESVVIIQH